MKEYPIITISREYGSGGRIIGKRLAEELGLPFYDKELITRAAADSGLSPEVLEQAEDHTPSSLLYTLSTGNGLAGLMGGVGMPLGDQLFLAQFDAIRKIAGEGPSVIVGRCANYVLKDRPGAIHFFIHADIESRIARITKEYGVPEKEAEAKIAKTDKRRATYYNHYTSVKWGQARNYHLSVDSAALGVERTARLLKAFVTAYREEHD